MNTKQKLILTLPVIALIVVSGFIYWFMIVRKTDQWTGLLLSELAPTDFLWCLAGIVCSLGVMFAFIKLIPIRHMYDANVRLLADSFSNKFLALYFIPNAFYEELIFRGALQPIMGIVPAALLFTVVHVAYYKKPVLLAEVFCQGIILGLLFQLTGSVWITTIAHAAFNTLQTWMIKKDIIPYHEEVSPLGSN